MKKYSLFVCLFVCWIVSFALYGIYFKEQGLLFKECDRVAIYVTFPEIYRTS